MPKRTVALFSVVIALAMSQNVIVNNGQVRTIPKTMNYQGYLTDATGNPITNPSISMTFTIFDAMSSGNQKWTESQTVAVDKGIFNVMLGSIAPIPDSVFTKGIDRWLQLTVGAQVLSPRTKIIATSYAYTATYSDTAEYARNTVNDNDWIRVGTDSVLYTARRLGVARGSTSNMLFGDSAFTHTNFGGYACTTGINGTNMTYATICGGYRNRADSLRSTVVGGYRNYALGGYSFIGGGSQNTAGGTAVFIGAGAINTTANVYSAIGGGYANTVSGAYGVIAGGRSNSVAGSYSAIAGGYADTITATGIYSYLFGIGSKLTRDSTFMVDVPHVWYGTEAAGYEFPRSRGADGQVMVTNGTGQLSWGNPPAASKWTVTDSVLYTNLRWGLARGGVNNILYGTNSFTHNNFGAWACTTGINGAGYGYITIAGGYGNRADSLYTTVVGGLRNLAVGQYSFVGGGNNNSANGRYSVVPGGSYNTANAIYSNINGGYGNFCEGAYSAILGGRADTITLTGDYSCLFGINSNLTQDSTFMVDMPHVWFGTEAAGYELPRNDGSNGQIMVTDGSGQLSWISGTSFDDWTVNDSALYTNQWIGLMRGGADNAMLGSDAYTHTNWGGQACTTGVSGQNYSHNAIGGGFFNQTVGDLATIAGGYQNTAGAYAFVGGGATNYANGLFTAVCGGRWDTTLTYCGGALSGYHSVAGDDASDTAAVIAGGRDNRVRAKYGFIGGGRENLAYGLYSAIAGGYGDTAIAYFSGVLSGIRNRAGSGSYDTASVVAGGRNNFAGSVCSFVGGGYANRADSAHSVVAGGYDNSALNRYTFVGSGRLNFTTGFCSAIAGGTGNDANGSHSFVGAGQNNTADSSYSVILSGDNNRATDDFSFIANGYNNYTAGYHTAILGGRLDTLTSLAFCSMAFGEQVYVNSDHRVVFFDGWNPGRFALNRDSHDGISYPIHVGTTTANGNGAYLTNGGIWSDGSSRYKKEDFQSLDGAVLLQKVAGLDITNWKFINSEERHISPVAQDFYKAFGCGAGNIEDDSTHIAAMDLAGVSLAAVQELNELVSKQKEMMNIQQKKIADLESRLKALENR